MFKIPRSAILQENRFFIMPNTNAERLLELFHYCSIIIHRVRHQADSVSMHHGQSKLLAILARHDIVPQRDLLEEMKIRSTSLSELLGKLERSGYVDRTTNPKDKRLIDVFLTPSGKKIVEQTSHYESGVADTMFSSLTDEEKLQLCALLEKLIASLEERFAAEDEERRGHRFGHGHAHELFHGHFRRHRSDEEGKDF